MSSALPELEDRPREAAAPRRRIWPWLVAAGLILGLVAVREMSARRAVAAEADARAREARPLPVVTATARTGDEPDYLRGLGTATAFNTATLKSRVDGQLLSVAVQEGQSVRAGELLAQIDPRLFEVQLEQARGQLARDRAARKDAQVILDRDQALMNEQILPQQQIDSQRAQVDELEGAIRSDEAQVRNAQLQLSYSRIVAPFSGRVGLRLVDAGNMVHASDPNGIAVITQLEPINVLFTIPADHLEQVLGPLHAGRRLAVDAYDRDLKKKLATGWLSAVDNQIDQSTGTVRLKALFPNADGALFPNQFVNARLLVDTVSDAVLVPAAAVQRSPQSAFVWLVGPDSTVAMRDVKVRLTEGDVTAVDGLSAGDSVVVDGVDKLQAGSKVAVAARGGSGASGSPGSGEAGRKRKS